MFVPIVCYSMLFSIALAFNVAIYKSSDYNRQKNPEPVHTVEETYKFEFNMKELLIVDIRLRNKAPDVKASVYVTYKHPTKDYKVVIENKTMKKCNHEDCVTIRLKSRNYKSYSISIGIQLEKYNVACATQIILQGNATLPHTTKKDTDRSLCLNEPRCTVVMDVPNECQVTAGLLTGLAVVIGVAAVVACIVLLYKKQCCCVKTTSEEPPQTCIADYPFYVNLLFRKECQAEIYAAEHVYEEIN